jgi:hypothetical protein
MTDVKTFVFSSGSEAHECVVKLLTGGVDCTSDINSVAELRAQIQTIRGLKPIPSWMFSILDNLEAQEAEHPGHYTSGKLRELIGNDDTNSKNLTHN